MCVGVGGVGGRVLGFACGEGQTEPRAERGVCVGGQAGDRGHSSTDLSLSSLHPPPSSPAPPCRSRTRLTPPSTARRRAWPSTRPSCHRRWWTRSTRPSRILGRSARCGNKKGAGWDGRRGGGVCVAHLLPFQGEDLPFTYLPPTSCLCVVPCVPGKGAVWGGGAHLLAPSGRGPATHISATHLPAPAFRVRTWRRSRPLCRP